MSQGRRPVLLLGPLVWLAVVVAVATLTWRVIDSAGRQVLTSGPTPSLNATGTTEPGPAATAKEGRAKKSAPSHRPDPSRSPDGDAEPTGTPGGGSTSAAPPAPSVAPPVGPSLVPSELPTQRVEQPDASQAPTQQPTQQPSQTPEQQPQVRSWRGSAGTVTAVCNGSRISLQSATPNDGWHVEVGDRGPEHIEVEFKTGGEDERGTHVTADCVSGAPRFSVEADD